MFEVLSELALNPFSPFFKNYVPTNDQSVSYLPMNGLSALDPSAIIDGGERKRWRSMPQPLDVKAEIGKLNISKLATLSGVSFHIKNFLRIFFP